METFEDAYIACALWSSTDDEGTPLDGGESELAPYTRAKMLADCADFQKSQANLLSKWYEECGETPNRAGHDFWLTRNRHGAGFWDRWNTSTPQGEIGRKLTDAAHLCGEVSLYVGDDGLIYA